MTKPTLKVPSMEIRKLRWTIAEQDATIAEKDASIAEKDATIVELRQQLAALQSNQQD
ncbi:MAG: hypothetical protein K2H12_06840 [Acetatifactor sp.]|nr:hypothetical protein [Acetatifactor sp.]